MCQSFLFVPVTQNDSFLLTIIEITVTKTILVSESAINRSVSFFDIPKFR